MISNKLTELLISLKGYHDPLVDSDVTLPQIPEGSIPEIQIKDVHKALLRINTKTSTVADDMPAKVIKMFALELSPPLADIINTSVRRGEFANLWKLETVTPVPKVFHPWFVNSSEKYQFL